MNRKTLFIYNLQAGDYLEELFISAIVSILGIRFYLHITHYPKIGGGNFHIAHMFWGGLLMLSAVIILISFIDRKATRLSAIIGGIGFGAFIDEIGKVITSNNNYFFEPSVAIIYVIFVLLFLIVRFIEKDRDLPPEAYLDNAFEATRNLLFDPANEEIKNHAKYLLEKCDPSSPITKSLLSIVGHIETISKGETENIFSSIGSWIRMLYHSLINKYWFTQGIILFFICFSLFNLYKSSNVLQLYFNSTVYRFSDYIDLGQFLSSLISSVIIVIGIARIRISRLKAYSAFKVAVILSIVLTQFFDFYHNQLNALVVLLLNLIVLLVLQYLIEEERLVVSQRRIEG